MSRSEMEKMLSGLTQLAEPESPFQQVFLPMLRGMADSMKEELVSPMSAEDTAALRTKISFLRDDMMRLVSGKIANLRSHLATTDDE